ncbi:MAG: 2Fe-2S iron-sulfur cluster binding domain-containing protein [Thiogranum sp.]|jgi:CDP-4-dehydro-6-deoxyglucose reductase|nr:2Fe-2S iron-sulfur cluster binding domain-containing protein [Thiogranum sp.]
MLGLFKNRKQDWKAEISPSGKQVLVKAGDNLLKSALNAGLRWPHDCRVGSCGTCRCTLKQGKVKELSDFAYVLSQEELQSGMILACQAALRSDVVVEVDLIEDSAETVAVKSHESVIHSVKPLTHDIVELVIKAADAFPRTARAGQYAELAVAGIDRPRSYSFARAPENESEREATFFIRRVPGGEFTEWLFAENRAGEAVLVTGPYGAFWLRPGDGPIVCVAGGSGLAPVKALLESALNAGTERRVLFLFGARTRNDLYCLDVMERLGREWKCEFEFVPVLSDEPGDSDWEGARGMVTDYLKQAYVDTGKIDLSHSQAYLCGPPPMVDAAAALMGAAGMTKEDIHFDKFLDASSMPGGRK